MMKTMMLIGKRLNVFFFKNYDFFRLAIYNWTETGNPDIDVLEAMKVFRPNVILSIINPYHQKSRDGQNTIRVEGPEFLRISKH